jgi:hypothetical protein
MWIDAIGTTMSDPPYREGEIKMSERFPTQQVVTRAEPARPSRQLPDASSAAEHVVAQALGFCAHKMALGGPQAAVDALRQGNCAAHRYCFYDMARQVAGSIGSLDEHVKAVYTLEYDATPEDLCFDEARRDAALIHLIVWTGRKTAAFDALVAALDRALIQACSELLGLDRLAHLLDVHVMDDADVERCTGYAALLSSIHHRPIQVWER